MPRYQWLIRNKHDLSDTEAKMKAMVSLGVPYTESDIENARENMKTQAEGIANNILEIPDINTSFEEEKKFYGTQFIPLQEREIIALIAYLQRLGTDIKVKDIKEQLSKNN
jgi:cytochrome c oxidase cbb3-type subunit I/II